MEDNLTVPQEVGWILEFLEIAQDMYESRVWARKLAEWGTMPSSPRAE
jgi:hypothetical protein